MSRQVDIIMPREQINYEQAPARFPEGTLERIEAVLTEGESRSEFIRKAVETELRKRERKHAALEAEKKRKK
jgi:Arc/MetJ-type ribon-helix-helix transcriptional regulator